MASANAIGFVRFDAQLLDCIHKPGAEVKARCGESLVFVTDVQGSGAFRSFDDCLEQIAQQNLVDGLCFRAIGCSEHGIGDGAPYFFRGWRR